MSKDLNPKFINGRAFVRYELMLTEADFELLQRHAQGHRDSGSPTWTAADSIQSMFNRGIGAYQQNMERLATLTSP